LSISISFLFLFINNYSLIWYISFYF